MYEIDNQTNKIKFSHNPFSMPQGDIDTINFEKPLEILAYQYDICLLYTSDAADE